MRLHIDGIEPDGQPIQVTFDGHEVGAALGDTIASAMVDAGLLACRTTARGDQRGVFCGMGVCHECAVVVDGVPSRLACMTAVSPAMIVDTQPPAAPLANAVVSPLPERTIAPDVLVIGGGPAGLTATITAAQAGLDVLLVDERSKLGGQYFKQPSATSILDRDKLDDQYSQGRGLIDEVTASGASILLGVRVWGASSSNHLLAMGPHERYVIRPKRLVLGTGAYERAVPLPGWTLPGAMTTGAAQSLIRSNQVAPGRRVLVSGNGPLNLQLAADMVNAGVDVVALTELADTRWWSGLAPGAAMAMASPGIVLRGMRYRATLMRRGVPVLHRTSLTAVVGDGQVESAVVSRLDNSGHAISGTERSFEVDAICMGFGFLPTNELPRALGCDHRLDSQTGALVVDRAGSGRTSVDTVWVVGDAGQVAGAQAAMSQGVLAGCEIAESLGLAVPGSIDREKARRQHSRYMRFQKHLWRLYRAPTPIDQLARGDTIVCRCETVSLSEISAALEEGASTAGAIKRTTRAGMGKCQARYCGPIVTALSARRSGEAIGEFSGFAPQIPFGPTDIFAIAGGEQVQGTPDSEGSSREFPDASIVSRR